MKKEEESKYLVDEPLERFNQILRIRIIRNKEAFLLHHTFGYLKELWDWAKELSGVEPIFTYTVRLKILLLKDFENEWGFLCLGKFFMAHISVINSWQFSIDILRGQGFQQKHKLGFFSSFVSWKVMIMSFKTLLKIPEDMSYKTTYLNKTKTLIP